MDFFAVCSPLYPLITSLASTGWLGSEWWRAGRSHARRNEHSPSDGSCSACTWQVVGSVFLISWAGCQGPWHFVMSRGVCCVFCLSVMSLSILPLTVFARKKKKMMKTQTTVGLFYLEEIWQPSMHLVLA